MLLVLVGNATSSTSLVTEQEGLTWLRLHASRASVYALCVRAPTPCIRYRTNVVVLCSLCYRVSRSFSNLFSLSLSLSFFRQIFVHLTVVRVFFLPLLLLLFLRSFRVIILDNDELRCKKKLCYYIAVRNGTNVKFANVFFVRRRRY